MGLFRSTLSSGSASNYRASSSSQPVPPRAPRRRFHIEDKNFVETNPNGNSRDIYLVTSRLKPLQKLRDLFGDGEAEPVTSNLSKGVSSDAYTHWSVEVGGRNNDIVADTDGHVRAKTMRKWTPNKTRRILSRDKVGTTTVTDAELWESNEMAAEDIRVYHPKFNNCQKGSKQLLKYIGDQHIDVDFRQTATQGYAQAVENTWEQADNVNSRLGFSRTPATERRAQIQRQLDVEESAFRARTEPQMQWVYLQTQRR